MVLHNEVPSLIVVLHLRHAVPQVIVTTMVIVTVVMIIIKVLVITTSFRFAS